MKAPAPSNMQQDKAVLFADVCGSTHLYETLGDARAFATINACLDILRHLTSTHNGVVVKTIGDEIMAVFPDAVSAAQAACEMQMVVNAQPPIDDIRVDIRIGFHFGPLLENPSDGDVFGDTVNIAARLAEIAHAKQIITTDATVAMFPPIIRSGTRTLNRLSIKGKTEDIEVLEVIWQESDEMTMVVSNTFSPKTTEPTLTLIYREKEFIVNAAHPSLTIGRDDKADIVVTDRSASRMHAKIERRRNKFVLIDMSSNGSFVVIKRETEIPLRHEELVLRESGTISLGHPYRKDPTEIIEFICKN